MPTEQLESLEERVEVEERVDRIEEILPTLSTKEDVPGFGVADEAHGP